MLSWTSKLKNIFSSSESFSNGIKSIFSGKKIDQSLLDKFEEILISSDFGAEISKKIINAIKEGDFSGDNIENSVESLIKKNIAEILLPSSKTINIVQNQLNIILVVGVNGSGKTTTIGKLAAKYVNEGLKVKIAACDTFRAAAVEQMKIWADRIGVDIITTIEGKGDPASVAYNAILQSKEDGTNLLFIDTAGRLQNNQNLMAELEKIVRVIKKFDNTAPHYSLIVLDGTSGQNTISQCEHFSAVAKINGIIVTKLDGTAKAGTIVHLTEKFKLPIYFIGVGEKVEDLREFKIDEYIQSIFK
jgi:fused signal recognition particle receptor